MYDFVVESLSWYNPSSLGIVGKNIASSLSKLGKTVSFIPWGSNPKLEQMDCNYWLRVAPGQIPINTITAHCNRFLYMPIFESTGMTNWFPYGNFYFCNNLVCPSYFIKNHLPDLFKQPKVMYHHGTEITEIKEKKPNTSSPLHLFFGGTLDTRKYGDEFIDLFAKAFGNSKEVDLTVKCQPSYDVKLTRKYSNIKFIKEVLDFTTLIELYYKCDVALLPSRGEGFGLMGLEAAACGLPIIGTDIFDYSPDCEFSAIDAKLISTPENGPWLGDWLDPDPDHIVVLIDEYIDNRSRLQKAIDKREDIINKWSWESVTKKFLNELS
jgi:glycosyltransferase involved in cell wall biosynthesis